MLCMTPRSTNLLCAPQTPSVSVLRPPGHHQSTPEEHPQQEAPTATTRDTPGPATPHSRDHPAPPTPAKPAQHHQHIDGNALDLEGPPRPTPPDPGHPPFTPATIDHQRPRPPPSNPPRQGPGHSPWLVLPTRELDQAHRQGPGPSHPGKGRHEAIADLILWRARQHTKGQHIFDPPRRVGPGPDTEHRHQRHTLRDHTATKSSSGEGPPSRPGPSGTAPPASAPPMTTPPPGYRQQPPPARRSGAQSSSAGSSTWWPPRQRPPAHNGSSRGPTPCSPQGLPHQGQ